MTTDRQPKNLMVEIEEIKETIKEIEQIRKTLLDMNYTNRDVRVIVQRVVKNIETDREENVKYLEQLERDLHYKDKYQQEI